MINRPGARILCIDNDSRSRDWIKIVLKGSKVECNITTVTTGREAFSLLNREKFDLCILEYSLPDMSGVQLCSLIRRMGSDVPMLFFSAMNSPIHKANARAAGATEYLVKPGDLAVFAATVRSVTSTSKTRASSSIAATPLASTAPANV